MPQATQEELKAAYRRLCMLYHPDKHRDPELKRQAEQLFNLVHEAYEGKTTFTLDFLCQFWFWVSFWKLKTVAYVYSIKHESYQGLLAVWSASFIFSLLAFVSFITLSMFSGVVSVYPAQVIFTIRAGHDAFLAICYPQWKKLPQHVVLWLCHYDVLTDDKKN